MYDLIKQLDNSIEGGLSADIVVSLRGRIASRLAKSFDGSDVAIMLEDNAWIALSVKETLVDVYQENNSIYINANDVGNASAGVKLKGDCHEFASVQLPLRSFTRIGAINPTLGTAISTLAEMVRHLMEVESTNKHKRAQDVLDLRHVGDDVHVVLTDNIYIHLDHDYLYNV